ncbi:TniQ family protein [Ralstonia solanacearum]|nr:TniQ family protein [Ralstonia solanacearum]
MIRIAEGNGFPSVTAMVDGHCAGTADEGWIAAAYTRTDRYAEILQLCGVDNPNALSLSFERLGPTAETPRLIDGVPYGERFFSQDCRAYCPICLAERRYFRKHWALEPYQVCHVHSVRMLRDCHVCKKVLSPLRGSLCTCKCGARLGDASPTVADKSSVDWWMGEMRAGGQRASDATACVAALFALEHRDGLLEMLNSAHQWGERGVVSAEIRALADNSPWHPRITLLPLLEATSNTVQALAREILRSMFWELPIDADLCERRLSQKQIQLALGISASQLTKLERDGVLATYRLKRGRGWYSANAANAMLCGLMASRTALTCSPRAITRGIASVLGAIAEGRELSAGYDLSLGISSLRSVEAAPPISALESPDEIGVEKAAEILGTYPDVVRFLARAGWLECRDRDHSNRKRLVTSRGAVECFARKYVFAGEVAKRANTGVTSTAERLMALGVPAVAGPKIDGSLVYMFERDLVDRLDLEALRSLKGYPTSTGRKPAGDAIKGERLEMPLAAAAELLGVSAQTAKRLVTNHHLREVSSLSRSVLVTRRSVQRFKKMLDDPDLLPVEVVPPLLGVGNRALEVTYIQSGLLPVLDLTVSRRVHRADIARLQEMRANYVTAEEAGKLLGSHRSHLPNLEKRGEINSTTFGKSRSVKFYALADIRKLLQSIRPVNRPDAHVPATSFGGLADLSLASNSRLAGSADAARQCESV